MRRPIACLALILSSTVAGGTPAVWAQNSDDRPPSLSDRLEQFRDDLLGQPNQQSGSSNPNPKPKTKTTPATNGSAAASTQRTQGQVGASVGALDSNPPTPTLAGKPPKATAGPSSRRTAQPSYKPARPATPDDATPEADSESFPVPAKSLKQPPIAEESVETEDVGKPAKTQAMPMPRVVRSAPHKPAAPAVETEKSVQPEPTNRSAHKTPAPVAPHGKDVLLTGRTPSLAIEATGPRKVMIGREAVFKVTLQNVGEVPANNVKVSLDIPPGAEIVDVQTTAGTNQPNSTGDGATPLEWEISRLAGHGHETLTLKLIPRQNAPIDLAVRWVCTPESSQMSVEVQEPKLAMSLSGPTEVLYGQL